VVYFSQYKPNPEESNPEEYNMLFDPRVLRVAHKLYRLYFEIHGQPERIPTGVAVNRNSYRGCLLFRHHPILLPDECFVPGDQLQSE
jgi:hypothetical protein